MTTLARIRTKTRRLTASPSSNQLTDSQIDQAVNDFYLYDLPEHLRLWNLKTVYSFVTEPNVDEYTFDFNNFVTIEPPLYIAGYQSRYSQSRDEFYRLYPQIRQVEDVATGNSGSSYAFTVTNTPVLRKSVLVSSVSSAGAAMNVQDDGQGNLTGDGTGTVNYATGAITVTFSAAVNTGTSIYANYYPYEPSRPVLMLFYNQSFYLRPVPDKAYKVEINGYKTPTQLVNSGDSPELNEWWELLAYGASVKILEERMDTDGLSKVLPLLQNKLKLVQRRTLKQYTPQRVATIYTDDVETPYGNFNNRF